ncbi:MAG: hypothetical protein E6J91_18915 [Deltaproteobacteria bacterium]|nr:MAG: hypothetical protein E6J91_18915 [Deltaproteobacteria bacterium]
MKRNSMRPRSKERFAIGSRVTSRVTAQGLQAGRSYTVEATQRTRTFVGAFVKVTLRDEAGMYEVVNAHLVLEDDV